jgi:chemotaxis response regulator CheB
MAKIFVVENDSSTQKFLRMLLGWQHHEIVGFATSADEAKTAIAVVQPDLCLIDVNLLSSESGIDVAEYVIEQFGLPVIIMSGDDYPTLPVPFVLKPIRSQHLLSTIDKVLRSQ